MPKLHVVFFRDANGTVPFLSWFYGLPAKSQDACRARLALLKHEGHALRRPAAENLGRGIWELRAKSNRVNLRILYFFYGRHAAVVSQGFEKQAAVVPRGEMDLAIKRKRLYEGHPRAHTYEKVLDQEA